MCQNVQGIVLHTNLNKSKKNKELLMINADIIIDKNSFNGPMRPIICNVSNIEGLIFIVFFL